MYFKQFIIRERNHVLHTNYCTWAKTRASCNCRKWAKSHGLHNFLYLGKAKRLFLTRLHEHQAEVRINHKQSYCTRTARRTIRTQYGLE